jgi:hypothetical protein
MNEAFLLSSGTIVFVTLLLVAAVRKLTAKEDGTQRIDGGWIVFGCASVVGIGLSFAASYLPGGVVLATWAILVRGVGAGAAAFGWTSYKKWLASLLPAAQFGELLAQGETELNALPTATTTAVSSPPLEDVLADTVPDEVTPTPVTTPTSITTPPKGTP